nr:MAG TPA: hypothetical protein [Inoviridae sp.]
MHTGVTRTAHSGFSAGGIRWGVIPVCKQLIHGLCIGGKRLLNLYTAIREVWRHGSVLEF